MLFSPGTNTPLSTSRLTASFEMMRRMLYLQTKTRKLLMNDLAEYIGRLRFRGLSTADSGAELSALELLVLSACETAEGDERAALGLAGLAIKAGARSALGTLWSVNDEAAGLLVVEFYRQLRNNSGVSKAEALRQAQLAMLQQKGKFGHPQDLVRVSPHQQLVVDMSKMAKTAGLLLVLTLASTATAEQISTPVVQQEGPPARLSSAPIVDVKAYRIRGNTVFPAEELARVTQPWVKNNVTTEDLFAVRDALTRYYIQRGYINSGATVPDQDVVDGVIDLVITEGRLTRIDVLGAKWFRSAYFEKRLSLDGRPLNVAELERGLQHLQRAGRGRRLSATLTPGLGRGESDLTLSVQERIPVGARVEYSNHQAPSIGGQRGQVSFSYDSLTGNGDVLGVTFGKTTGLEDFSIAYQIPVTSADTTLRLQFRSGDSVVIEEPFNAVDIASWSRTYSVSLSHPFRRRAGSEWTVAVSGDVRESKTWLLGRPFSFSEGATNGRSKVAVIRGSQSWTQSTRTQVLAMRSQLSVGIDALGASINSDPISRRTWGKPPSSRRLFCQLAGAVSVGETAEPYARHRYHRENGLADQP